MSTQEQSTNCTNSTNSSISEIREISEPSPKISVIVPVYKVEKYLPECIESVLAQTFTDFELILVDDGSPDNSGKICDDYAARDPRIRVFHKQNGGVSSARNLGLDHARADWVAFVDADDAVDNDFLEELYRPIEKENVPAVVVLSSLYYEWVSAPEKNFSRSIQYSRSFFEHESLSSFFSENRFFTAGDGGSVSKLFHMDSLRKNNIHFFEKNAAYEDTLFSFSAVLSCERVFCRTASRYHYLHREEASLSRKLHPYKNFSDSGAEGLTRWQNFLKKYGKKIPEETALAGISKFLGIYLYSLFALYKTPQTTRTERLAQIRACQTMLRKNPQMKWDDIRMGILSALLRKRLPISFLDAVFIIFWRRPFQR